MRLTQRWINPVLEKEFRLRMRTWRSPLALLFYLGAVGLLGFAFMFAMNVVEGGDMIDAERSQAFFYFLSFTQLALISFMTPGLTAGAISGEREKQTLNILLTTQQSSAAIIISKLVSSISFMLFIVVATMPLYSIVFLFGGISPLQLITVFLFYIYMMFVLASFGMFFSTVFKRTMVSVITAYGVLLFIYGFTAFLALFFEAILKSDVLPELLFSMNPIVALWSIIDRSLSQTVFSSSAPPYWLIFIIIYTALSLSALLLSIRYLRPRLKKNTNEQG